MNLQIYELVQNLSNLINNSHLPIGMVYYIIKDVYQQVQELYNQQIANEYNVQQEQHSEDTIKGFTEKSVEENNKED